MNRHATRQVKCKNKTKSHLNPTTTCRGLKTKAQIFYIMPKKNAKENGSFLRTRKTRTNRIKTDSSHSSKAKENNNNNKKKERSI